MPSTFTNQMLFEFVSLPFCVSSQDAIEMFSKAETAYNVLGDTVSRALYDMVVGIKPESEEEVSCHV